MHKNKRSSTHVIYSQNSSKNAMLIYSIKYTFSILSPYYSISSIHNPNPLFILYSLFLYYFYLLPIYLYFLLYVLYLLGYMVFIRMFLDLSIIIANVIDIYIFGLIAIWISGYIYIYYLGLVIYGYMFYFRVLGIDCFLYILSLIEFIGYYFISLTLSNRISINIVAGCLLSYLLGILCSSYIIFLLVIYGLYIFESLNLFFQCFIFIILVLFIVLY